MDVFRKLTGLRLQDVYNLMLKKGWTLGSPQLMVGMHCVIRLFHSQTGAAARGILAREPPGPGGFAGAQLQPRPRREPAPRAARQRRWSPSSPISPTIRRTSGSSGSRSTSSAARTRRWSRRARWAMPRTRCIRASGMILSPRFYEIAPLARRGARRGTRARWASIRAAVGLVLFGGQGSAVMLDIARPLARSPAHF